MTTYDPTKKKFVVTSKEAGRKSYSPMIRLDSVTLQRILKFAQTDGFELSHKSKAGKTVPDNAMISRAVKIYVLQAVSEWIEARETIV